MEAIEFETDIKNGIIKIPSKYNNFLNRKVKLIILSEESAQYNQKDYSTEDFFSKYNIDLKNYKFNRDELYDR
ncbi:MAG: hypothetical protein A2086_09600 [Spirochaetes bacterium GWD1_27_9]|nr:MAG: hypothetical protein A2Z98_14130 [Spirochaetes bacterium GWB1_27_13]OHD25978.1 MAG: hypothetical protein A2Y34_07030 [Spirochaetes bacterium GWC1_27_15]OHD31656.1 MAG: hypothetical protein A2086_09600 [Spirochaetes bacterium GWD1_27_9]